MKKNHYHHAVKAAGLFLFTATASAQTDDGIYQDSTATNRFTLSVRFGLNIDAKFSGVGGSLNPSFNNTGGRYDNGYVLTDVSGNAGNQTWYWGYDNSSQVNAVANTVSFNRTTATPVASSASGNADSGVNTGFELAYDRQFGVKEDWHNMRYGLELAVNFLPFCLNSSSTFGANVSHAAVRAVSGQLSRPRICPQRPALEHLHHAHRGRVGFLAGSF